MAVLENDEKSMKIAFREKYFSSHNVILTVDVSPFVPSRQQRGRSLLGENIPVEWLPIGV